MSIDITSESFQQLRIQAHDDAEALADDARSYQGWTGAAVASDQARDRGLTGVAYQEYTLWFAQVWNDWQHYGHCTHTGGS